MSFGKGTAKTKEVRDTDSMETGGEQKVGGAMAALESDDNALDAAHNMGLYRENDEEHPDELNLANEMDKKERRSKSG